MDRNFYYQTRAKELQREISQELANRHLLSEAEGKYLAARRLKRTALRFAPVMIIVALLVFHFLS